MGTRALFQFVDNRITNMGLNEQTQKFEYLNDDLVLAIRGDSREPIRYPLILFNSQSRTANAATYLGLESCFLITVFDFDKTRSDGESWTRANYKYGIDSPITNNNNVAFAFDANSISAITGRQGAIQFIEEVIPDNTYVMFYLSTKDGNVHHKASTWAKDSSDFGKNIFQVLEKQGAQVFKNIMTNDSVHYFIIFKKNGGNVIKEKLQNTYSEGINESINIPRKWYTGTQITQLIGPSKKWDRLDLSYTTGVGDTLGIDVIGILGNKTEITLKTDIITSATNFSDIDASKYIYLQLKYKSRDIRQQTPPQLNSWRIYYQGLPDLAVNPSVNYSKYADTLQQGDKFTMSIGVENISDYDTDSVAVALTLKNEQNQSLILQKKIQAIGAGNTAVAPFEYDTKSLDGKHQVFFEVNPKLAQPESFTGNNYLQTNMTVQSDKSNPLLDVTFNGIKILNNDIVSSKPQIRISLRDDNKYLLLQDTSLFKMTLQAVNPAGTPRPMYFKDPSVKFSPATANIKGENKATIELNPDFLTDGIYRLVVGGKDASGNNSGAVDYSVQFRVITKQAISNLLPYPNPFSTSTRFAYTLTGDSPLNQGQTMKIQIMTVSGRVVREITQDEIGQLKVGTHLTDFAWDGKDDFGSLLANGVYLYRVIIKDKNKQKIEKYDNANGNLDAYFKKDFGKIVIMR